MTAGQIEETIAFHKKFNEMVATNIVFAIARERLYQDRKYGAPKKRALDVGTYLVIMHHELGEAMAALATKGADEAMVELLQVVAVGVAAMERHGVIERPDVGAKVFL